MKRFLLVCLLIGLVFSQDALPGGVVDDDEHDPEALNALNEFFIELIQHATENSCFDKENERIVVGEIEKITQQVVSGEKFEFILRAGVSDKCADVGPHPLIEAANGNEEYNKFVVSAKECGIDNEKLGRHDLSIVWQAWKAKKYNYSTIKDMDNSSPLEGLWTGGENGCRSHRI